jgi:hypothetical protein
MPMVEVGGIKDVRKGTMAAKGHCQLIPDLQYCNFDILLYEALG